jgi:hypothetical protein
MPASLALVHHANQYLITEGYDNREGLGTVLDGLSRVMRLHRRTSIPLNLHISGTLLEAAAWHRPEFLEEVRALVAAGLAELVGSSYGQNIMRFFGADYNRRQLNEELSLYEQHLGVDPRDVKAFWPPERVWDTRRMAPVLRDATLRNDGYRYVILDDRVLLPCRAREDFDRDGWSPDVYRVYEMEGGLGLLAFPIATRLRRTIPPRHSSDWTVVRAELEGLLVHAAEEQSDDFVAVYADDMEKIAGLWGSEAPAKYAELLEWLTANRKWIEPVRLSAWAQSHQRAGRRPVETGTFEELAREFDAGEGYEKWYLAADWAPYRAFFDWSEKRVHELAAEGCDEALLELAEKHLLVSNWETAWHTPPDGPHGDPSQNGHASPWARALTSHSRHAAVIAEAARWMRHKDGMAHAELRDIDNDGDAELIFKNSALFAVIAPRWGARLVALFHVGGERGAMVIGNPCDDWNWMEELNRFMDVPRNHPGAFADDGFEHEAFETGRLPQPGSAVAVALESAHGLSKEYRLEGSRIGVTYTLPDGVESLAVEFGLSPDYLRLLRDGRRALTESIDGCAAGGVAVAVKPEPGLDWETPRQEVIGHASIRRVAARRRRFTIDLEVTALEKEQSRGQTAELEPALL